MVIDTENVRRAALVPPLPALPKDTGPNRRTSYQTAITPFAVAFHAQKVAEYKATRRQNATARQIKEALATATNAQLTAALTALTT